MGIGLYIVLYEVKGMQDMFGVLYVSNTSPFWGNTYIPFLAG